MNCAFICWRPYQIFNALNLVYNDVEGTRGNSDLYIQDLPIMQDLAERIARLGCFKNIYVFEEKNRGDGVGVTPLKMAGIYAMRTVNFIAPVRAIKKNCPEIKEFRHAYDAILCSGWISFSMELANCNPGAKIILFEDGSGNYVNDLIENMPRVHRAYYGLLKTFFGRGPLVIKVACMYVYEPGSMAVKRKYPVKAMPKISDGMYEVLCRVFQYDESSDIYTETSTVFLDQPLKHIGKGYDQNRVIEYLAQDPSFICRRHPVQKVDESLTYEDRKRPMWELVANKFTNNTVLVSTFSTGQLTPAMIYGVYPTLVFLYRLNEPEGTDAFLRVKKFIDMFRASYRGKIYEPRSFAEFTDVMTEIREQRQKESRIDG